MDDEVNRYQDSVRHMTNRRILAEDAQREVAVRAMVDGGECICMEIVDGVVRPSETFVHPYCPQHGSLT